MIRPTLELNTENILKYVSPLDIYSKYSKDFKKINKHFHSDFRKDPNPSAIIYQYDGTFFYKDFGGDDGLNCFQFVMKMFDLSFKQALEKINTDFNLNIGTTKFDYNRPIVKYDYPKSEFKTIIQVKKRPFNEEDLIWWGNQAWTKDMLLASNISPISHFRLTSERKNIDNKLYICDQYSYSMDYYFHNGIFRRKLYFPFKDKINKWVSNVDKTIVQNWNLFPKKGDIGFITSGYKDGGPIWRIYNSPIFLAPNAEGTWFLDKFWYKIKPRYKKWVIFFDNDETGIKNAKKFSQIYNIDYICTPIGSPKDPAAFWAKHGGREFNYYLQNQLDKLKL